MRCKKALFDHNGYLTGEGKIKFWNEIDLQFRSFDQGDIDLLPSPVVSNSRNSKALMEFKNKLPTPLPRKKDTAKYTDDDSDHHHKRHSGSHHRDDNHDDRYDQEEYYTSRHRKHSRKSSREYHRSSSSTKKRN